MGPDEVQNQIITVLVKTSSKLPDQTRPDQTRPDQTRPEENSMNIEDGLIQL
jgi:hypothetical protein